MVVVNTKNSNPYLKIMALNTAFHAHTHKKKMGLLKDATIIQLKLDLHSWPQPLSHFLIGMMPFIQLCISIGYQLMFFKTKAHMKFFSKQSQIIHFLKCLDVNVFLTIVLIMLISWFIAHFHVCFLAIVQLTRGIDAFTFPQVAFTFPDM